MRKSLISLFILIVAIELEFMFSSFGIFFDLTLGALIAFACALPFREFVVLDLCAAVIFRMISFADPLLLSLIIFPVLVWVLYKNIRWEPLAMIPIMAAIGVIIMVLASGIPLASIGFIAILEDIVITSIMGVLSYMTLQKV